MDYERLKNAVKSVELSEEGKNRIIRNCQSRMLEDTEKLPLGKRHWFQKAAVLAAAVSVLLGCAAVAAAAVQGGFFKDITNWKGAVIGTRYEQASEEIEVRAAWGGNGITVYAAMVNPNVVPFCEMETLGLGTYKIMDLSGKTVMEGENTELFSVDQGKAEILIPLDSIGSGDYRLVITAFAGGKKADQPLPIHGTWECDLSI